jgi:hypothetical protein
MEEKFMSVPKVSEIPFSSPTQLLPSVTSAVQEGRMAMSKSAQKVDSIVDFCRRFDRVKDNDKTHIAEFDLLLPLEKLQVLACIANKPLFSTFFCELPFEMIKKYTDIASSILEARNRTSHLVPLSPLELRSATIAQYIVELITLQPLAVSSSTRPRASSQPTTLKEKSKREMSDMEKVLDYCKDYAPWKLEKPESIPVKQCVALFKGLKPFQKIEVLDRISSGPYIYFFYCHLPQSMQERLQDIYASVKNEYETFQDSDTWIAISMDRYKQELR